MTVLREEMGKIEQAVNKLLDDLDHGPFWHQTYKVKAAILYAYENYTSYAHFAAQECYEVLDYSHTALPSLKPLNDEEVYPTPVLLDLSCALERMHFRFMLKRLWEKEGAIDDHVRLGLDRARKERESGRNAPVFNDVERISHLIVKVVSVVTLGMLYQQSLRAWCHKRDDVFVSLPPKLGLAFAGVEAWLARQPEGSREVAWAVNKALYHTMEVGYWIATPQVVYPYIPEGFDR